LAFGLFLLGLLALQVRLSTLLFGLPLGVFIVPALLLFPLPLRLQALAFDLFLLTLDRLAALLFGLALSILVVTALLFVPLPLSLEALLLVLLLPLALSFKLKAL
jgi:hypothetical protein